MLLFRLRSLSKRHFRGQRKLKLFVEAYEELANEEGTTIAQDVMEKAVKAAEQVVIYQRS